MSCSNCDSDCANVDCDCPPFLPVPGPQGSVGPVGPQGISGTNGTDAYTTLTAQFTQPAVSASVVAAVVSSKWIAIGSYIFVENGGYYLVVATPTPTSVTLQNTGSTLNSSPTTVVANGGKVSAAGFEGPALLSPLPIAQGGTGQATKALAFDALSPNTTTGDLTFYTAGSNTRLGIGTSSYILTVAGGVPAWALNAPAAANITGEVAVANGGTGASTAAGARTNLAVPGLATSNIFTNSNLFDVGAGNFRVASSSIAVILCSSSFLALYDLTGQDSLNWKNRHLVGQWAQSKKAYVNASASTYTVPAASTSVNVETVVSTYSATGTQAITLPAGVDGRVVRITDGAGLAGTNPLTILRSGSDTIMDMTSYVISNNYGSIALIYLASATNWVPLP